MFSMRLFLLFMVITILLHLLMMLLGELGCIFWNHKMMFWMCLRHSIKWWRYSLIRSNELKEEIYFDKRSSSDCFWGQTKPNIVAAANCCISLTCHFSCHPRGLATPILSHINTLFVDRCTDENVYYHTGDTISWIWLSILESYLTFIDQLLDLIFCYQFLFVIQQSAIKFAQAWHPLVSKEHFEFEGEC